MGDIEIKASNNVRFLGINFSSKLDWNSQINHLWSRCQCPNKIISCLTIRHTWWGADPRLLRNIYIALIRSRIDYGCFLLHDISKNQKVKLDRIQFKALRISLGLRTSSLTNFILGETKEPPRSFCVKNFCAKVIWQEFLHSLITQFLRFYVNGRNLSSVLLRT